MTRLQPDQLADEAEIVWLENIETLDYVREAIVLLWSRGRRPRKDMFARLVGYAVLKPDTKPEHPGMFHRRVFWLMSHDRNGSEGTVYSPSGAPSEAVDPRTVAPGVPGQMTDRAWGRPDTAA